MIEENKSYSIKELIWIKYSGQNKKSTLNKIKIQVCKFYVKICKIKTEYSLII